ncbi:vitamin B12 transporter BtuB [Psychromonas marina]|uniref:Vitamin B12 transporter BtuB n=1 Tax=Psychromonas marina TaxID=88364 RepID=A0ABQ6DXU4_9GAMM|nr:TonB-dependent receptor [Psychromonas marina]GLS89683.1 vitamin B12 transporter BtuB [Psychromonas marina]
MFTHRHTPIALALLSLYSATTFANDTVESNERMDVLIVKGYSAPSATTQSYSGDTVINIVPTNNDINKSLDQLIAENSPGFVHTNSGTSKHNSSNYHRGLSDEYTLYLLNGVAFPSSTLGSQNIPDIPMESIALIEVIRGAQASLYGSNSLTGVINIVTKTGETTDAKFNISAGSNDTGRIGGMYADNFSVGKGKIQFMTSLDVEKSDGYDFIEASDDDFGYNTYSMNSYAAYVTESNRFSLAINNARSNVDIYSTYYFPDYTSVSGQVENTQETYQVTGKYIQQLTKNITSELTLSHANLDLEAENFNSADINNYSTNSDLAQLHINTEWERLAVNFGGEYTHSKYQSNANSEDRDQTAFYLAFSGDVTDYLNISGGLRNDNYSDFGNALTYSAGISLFDTATLSYKTSFSAPSYNDLYWPDVGNPDLESEEGEMLELSLTHNIETNNAYIPLKLNLYTGSLDNKINWAPISEGSPIWSPSNIDTVDIKGIEAYMQYNASKFVFDIAASYSQSIDKSTDEQLANVPEWSGSSSIQYNVTNSVQPKLTYSYIGDRSSGSTDLDAVHLLGFAISYQAFEHVNIGFNVDNITDNDNQLHKGYNAAGRTYLFTIGANL